MTITDPTTPVVEPRWPRWALIVFPVLAIAVGGGLGYVVPVAEVATRTASPTVAKPIAPVRQPAPPAAVIEAPPPVAEPLEIEVQPEPVKSGGGVARPAVKPKHKPKPNKRTPCNVYEHMDGC